MKDDKISENRFMKNLKQLIDGCWVPVPTPPEPDGQPEPSGGSGNPSSGSSIPPIGPVARGFSIV